MAQAHQANVVRLEAELTEIRAKAKALRVASDARQVQLQAGEATVEKRRRQLREAHDNREYQALLDQIAADEMTNSVLADEALELMEKLDEANKKRVAAEETLAKGREEAEKARNECDRQMPLIRGDLQRLETERKGLEAELPADFLEFYRRLVRAKGGDALAPLFGEFCGGCNQHVPLKMINDLLLSRPIACKSCGRLLYLPEGGSHSDYAVGDR